MKTACRQCGFEGLAHEFRREPGGYRCPHCRRPVEVENAAGLEILDFTEIEGGTDAPPPGIQVKRENNRIQFRFRQSRAWEWAASFFGPVLLLLALKVFLDTPPRSGWPWFLWPSGIFCAVAGLALVYLALGCWCNRAALAIVAGRLTVRSGPLPGFGRRDLAAAQIERVYYRTIVVGRHSGRHVGHDLIAVLTDGRRLVLTVGLREEAQAHFLLRELQRGLGLRPRPFSPGSRMRKPVSPPARVQRETEGTTLRLRLCCTSWPVAAGLAALALLVNWLLFYNGRHALAAKDGALLGMAFLHAVGGAALAYAALGGLFNRTVLTAAPDELTVRERPFPLRRGRAIARSNLRQLYSRQFADDELRGEYEVGAIPSRYGDIVELLTDLRTPEEALFIEQEIEAWYGLRDQPTPAEMEI